MMFGRLLELLRRMALGTNNARPITRNSTPARSDLPRGIRNRNPGNIERNKIKWQGMAADQSDDARFCVFDESVYGIRALARVLLTYHRHRLAADGSRIDTVKEIIDRWAPPHENNTDAYAAAVRQALDVAQDEIIDVENRDQLATLVAAIIRHENGRNPERDDGAWYSKSEIMAGVDKALT